MLQTAKKILKSTNFHLQDVLKLKKRIIFHFRLLYSTFGHLKKKVQNLLKNSKNLIFLKFQILIRDWNRPGVGRYVTVRSAQSPSLSKIFFMQNGQKLTNLSQKKHTPPPKKRAFFFGGGGSGDRWSLRTMCLGLIFQQKTAKQRKSHPQPQKFWSERSFLFFFFEKYFGKIFPLPSHVRTSGENFAVHFQRGAILLFKNLE